MLRAGGGTGFWHETYFRGGQVESVYIDMPEGTGLTGFAPVTPARGSLFSARRLGMPEGKVGNPRWSRGA